MVCGCIKELYEWYVTVSSYCSMLCNLLGYLCLWYLCNFVKVYYKWCVSVQRICINGIIVSRMVLLCKGILVCRVTVLRYFVNVFRYFTCYVTAFRCTVYAA